MATTTYDDVVYPTRPRRATHPDALATVATLMGMRPAPVTDCRVLELGCGTGGNLTPMAATLPGSRFVGVDLSTMQIDMARRDALDLGLTNVEYLARSVTDLDGSFGRFDYVIAHGLYSWVPPAVQDAILTICSRNVAPNGVAYVSYNTYPGWHVRGAVREMVGWHVRDAADSHARLDAARGFLAFLAQAVPEPEGTYARAVRDEAGRMAGESDHYLFHEYLEADNDPVYFHEFMARAAAKGLQFLGESEDRRRSHELPQGVRTAVEQASATLVDLEQYHDFLWNRTFRRTLLCHDAVVLPRAPTPDTLDSLLASAAARPTNPAPDLAPGVVEEFTTLDGTAMRTNVPVVKAALAALFRVWPQAVPVPVLAGRVGEVLGPACATDPAQARGVLAQALVECYLTGLVGLHTHMPAFVTEASDRPLGSGVSRLQARRQEFVTTVRHQEVKPEPLDRFVLSLLDGTRDRAACAAAVAEAVRDGRLTLPGGADPAAAVSESFHRLGGCAVLLR